MNPEESPEGAADPQRRSLVRGAVVLGTVGVGAALSRLGAGTSQAVSRLSAESPTPAVQTGAGAAPATGGSKGRSVGPASGVPVGGGTIFDKAQVVVTQPTAGVFKAFDANCTHQKCLLADVEGGTINCACHGAKYSIADGSVVKPPARSALPAKTVTVSGGKLFVV